ncbi:LysR substrate-binding domain-containing protein [Yoonia sediminilitoris]|uniref:LysR family glycine cleavage system transcriptional activator n=1 Tax=Yoonia sediminilitoris TaxID=1286148 RepID=A0A2T6KHK2_9RHOB|nr:LysR substrate-binding domain-containing protein [Yoonia sediminilitoris]PUB14965.1 LysR family glycine cleavage system transcriptional activator [Yoonia sediminilitoris]RCW95681.1 LysR family glycine cleavage system transcriptional activator [Yoonia sediminilitoris]
MNNAPHLNYVRSFEAAARHLSFTAAAEELGYTQSAISHHVRSLEEFIGRPLFIRHPRSLALTTLGEAYLPAVRHALTEIDEATEAIMTSLHEKKVVVSCPISLAQNWLTRVVASFNGAHSDIAVTIHGRIWGDEYEGIADVSLSSARPEEAPDGADVLWREKLAVVCAPDYQVNGAPLTEPAQMRDAQLIHMLGRTAYWQIFAAHHGLTNWNLASGAKTNSLNVALELAACGQGCAIFPRSHLGNYLDRGLLVEPFATDIDSPWSCYISKPKGAGNKPAQIFRAFLIDFAKAGP